MSAVLKAGTNCHRVTRASRARVLIDGEAYFRAFARASLAATRSITIVGWDFHSRTRLYPEQEGAPCLLGDFLNFLVRRRRRLHIHVLVWDAPLMFSKGRELSPSFGIGWRPHKRVHFQYDDRCPLGAALHQKIVVIDGAVAFCGGLDLTRGRWDTSSHLASDPRRVNPDEQEPYAPFHDAMLCVDGEAARALYELIGQRWHDATGRRLPRLPLSRGEASDPWPADVPVQFTNIEVAIARTIPPMEGQPAVTEVQALYLDLIAAARDYIYIENQYFTASVLGDALAQRLEEPDGPEIVAVLRLSTQGWLEAPTMGTLRTVLLRKLRAADRHNRFRAYYTHIPDLPSEQCCDLHTKLMIVDDRYLRIGSANFSNRSMGLDTECDLVLHGEDIGAANAIRTVRDTLLAEHLDLDIHAVRSATRDRHSLIEAIDSLRRGSGRTLEPFEELDEPSSTVLAIATGVADPEKPVSFNSLVGFNSDISITTSSGRALSRGALMFVLVAGLFAIAALWKYTPLAGLTDMNRVITEAQMLADDPWAKIVVLVAYTPAAITLFPRSLITLFAVVAFGPVAGFVCALSGLLIAAWATYELGHRLDPATVHRIAGHRLTRLSRILTRRGFLAMTAVRLVPLAPFVVVNAVAGAIGVRLTHFLGASAVGLLPGTAATTVFAQQLVTGLHDPSVFNIGALLLMAVAVVLGAWAVRRWLVLPAFNGHGPRRP